MSRRITWQNVAAPSFGDAIEATKTAGLMVGRGFDSFGGAMDEVRQRQKTEASNQAMSEALKINESGGWDAAMANGGLSSFGISAKDATPELMAMLGDRRGDLLGDEGTITSTANTEADTLAVTARMEQAKTSSNWANKQNQYNWDKAIAADDLNAANLIKDKDALATATKVTRDATSAEEAAQAILNMNLDPDTEQRVLAAMESQPNRWGATADATAAAGQLPQSMTIGSELTARETALNAQVSTSPMLRIYSTAVQNYDGYSDPMVKVEEGLRSRADGDEAIIKESAGQLRGIFTDMKDEFSNVPPEVVAQVIEGELEQGGWFSGDKITVDKSRVRDMLKSLNDPEQLRLLGAEKDGIARSQATNAEFARKAKKAQEEWALAASEKDPAAQRRALAKLSKISADMLGAGGETSVDGGGTVDNLSVNPSVTSLDASLPVAGEDLNLPPSGGLADNILIAGRNNVAPVPTGIDSRISQGNQTFRRGARTAGTMIENALANSGAVVDDALGDASALGIRAAAILGEGSARAIGLVDPQRGSDMLGKIDVGRDQADALAEQGLFGAAPNPSMELDQIAVQEASARINTLDQQSQSAGQKVANDWATQSPADAISLIGEETGIPYERFIVPARSAMNILKSSVSSKEEKTAAKAKIKKFLDVARDEYKTMDRIPALDALLAEGSKWVSE